MVRQIGELILLAMIYYIIKLALIVWACETCKNQAQEISTTIHDVLNSIKDEQIKAEINTDITNGVYCIYFLQYFYCILNLQYNIL